MTQRSRGGSPSLSGYLHIWGMNTYMQQNQNNNDDISLPAELTRLRDLAYNLRWAWNSQALDLFRRLDADLWERSNHNPITVLRQVDRACLSEAISNPDYIAAVSAAARDLDEYMAGGATWYGRSEARKEGGLAAYFSAEFGLTECLRIYSGGLGVLAGDHLKSASDLGVPLVAVGLLYRYGYFDQQLLADGWQQELYGPNRFENLPLQLVRNADGTPLKILVDLAGQQVAVQAWLAQVGRVSLYLLDTNVDENSPEDHDITDRLYGGDSEARIRQEVVLGIGGYRLLEALGHRPTVYHMNEGHSGFLVLEKLRRHVESGLDFETARARAREELVFTTHTPVEAGHDWFSPEQLDRYFGGYPQTLGISRDEFLGLGRQNPQGTEDWYCMTILALRSAGNSNGVSELHGEVSRGMWHSLWPERPVSEVPITHITNGIHLSSFVSGEIGEVYDRHLGPEWREEPADPARWRRLEDVPLAELWGAHEARRAKLVAFARARVSERLERHGAPWREVREVEESLDPDVLTIGFARRFAQYKRATLLLHDPDRLERILHNSDRPVQVVFSGKAHPRDNGGKELIKRVVQLSREPRFRGKLVFLEGYDMAVARYLVQGADVWLNNPLRPLEASGTSGMKAAANGLLNLSTLDGWWAEAWEGQDPDRARIGWAIGSGEVLDDPAYQEEVEANRLYELLEQDVVPCFYDRDANGLPGEWLARMKSSISCIVPYYNTHRMVREYTERFYLPAAPVAR